MVDPDDPESIGHAIRDLIQNESRRAKIGEAGRRAVKEKFNYRKQYEPAIE